MKNVLLKNVSEEDWIKFRTEAIAHDMTIPEFLSYLIREHIEKYHTKFILIHVLIHIYFLI